MTRSWRHAALAALLGLALAPEALAQATAANMPAAGRAATNRARPAPAAPSIAGTRALPGRMPQLGVGGQAGRGFEPAPTPNPDILAPTTRESNDPQLGATLTRRAQGFGAKGDGFSPGSSYSGYFDRRGRAVEGIGSTLAPSFQLRVPLE